MERRRLLLRTALLIAAIASAMGLWAGRRGASTADVQAFSVEQYWRDTGLSPRDLGELIDDDFCPSSQRAFLACVNVLLVVGDRLHRTLDFEGAWRPTLGSLDDITEKTRLEPWKSFYAEDWARARHFPFRKLWDEISGYLQAAEASITIAAGLNAYLSIFRDPHTYLVPMAYFENVMSKSNPVTSALGLVFTKRKGSYLIKKVVEGSSAQKAGLRRGDQILSINGVSVSLLSQAQFSELLKSEIGDVLNFRLRRGPELMDIELVRELTVLPSVHSRVLPGPRAVGLITIHKFARQTCEETKAALLDLQSQKIQGLLVDLRDNSGGQMDEAACVVSLFIGPDRPVFRVRYLDPSRLPEVTRGEEARIWTGPTAVLMNSGTASAAEIMAGSLRHYGRAVLVGERTFGKGSFQEGEIWNRNPKVAIFQTKGFYTLPSGEAPQYNGLEPDVNVQFLESGIGGREDELYLNPMQPLQRFKASREPFRLDRCLDLGSLNSEDPQLGQARRALFCQSLAAAGESRVSN